MTGEELIQDLKNGQVDAFKRLVEDYKEKLINICYGFVNNKEDAEDITQDVFIEVYKSVAHFRGDAKLSTWLYRISVNKSLDFIRKKKRKKRFAKLQNFLGSERIIDTIPDRDKSNPYTIIENQERIKILYEAIETLTVNQKIVFTLGKSEGLKNKEIAEIIGTSLSSVESLMHRAKGNLRKKLYNYYEDLLE